MEVEGGGDDPCYMDWLVSGDKGGEQAWGSAEAYRCGWRGRGTGQMAQIMDLVLIVIKVWHCFWTMTWKWR